MCLNLNFKTTYNFLDYIKKLVLSEIFDFEIFHKLMIEYFNSPNVVFILCYLH